MNTLPTHLQKRVESLVVELDATHPSRCFMQGAQALYAILQEMSEDEEKAISDFICSFHHTHMDWVERGARFGLMLARVKDNK